MKWTVRQYYHVLAKNLAGSAIDAAGLSIDRNRRLHLPVKLTVASLAVKCGAVSLLGSASDARVKIERHKIPIRVAAYMVALIMLLPSSVNATTYVINMKFNEDTGKVYFEPQRLEISLGDEITWVQRDGDNGHNVISYPNRIPAGTKTFKSPMLKRPGTRWSKVFDKIGTYEYHCHPHEAAGMRGVIVVERESLPHEFRKAKSEEHDHSPEISQVVERESLPHKFRQAKSNGHDHSPEISQVVEPESLPHKFRQAKSNGHDHSPEISQVVEPESLPHQFERRNPRGPTIHPRLPR